MLAQMPVPAEAKFVRTDLGGMSGLRVSSPGVAEDAALLYIHGGCYIAGSAEGAIREGVLSTGDALPTVRALAETLAHLATESAR